MVQINGPRLLDSLRTLRTFGATGTGVVRQTFSDIDMASRHWLSEQMTSAGLDPVIDGVGSVYGRSAKPGPALLIGSHSDTQPNGGWLDGAMGVMYAIEIATALAEDPATSEMAIDAVSWADEEASYVSFLGSRSFVDTLPDTELGRQNAAGESARAAIARVGLADRELVKLEPGRHLGYLEPHIEQGPHLEEAGLRIGVVTSIVGIRAARIRFTGEQNHAGTTPMARRKDAGVTLFEFGVRMREKVSAVAGPHSVWTIGTATLEPGAESIIPGAANLTVQYRDADEAVLDRIEAAIAATAAELNRDGPVAVTVEPAKEHVAPAAMDPELRGVLTAAAEAGAPGQWVEMPSAAAHDAMVLAPHLPTAMLFVPSVGGISHDFAEDTADDDIVLGCQIMAEAAASLLEQRRRA